MKICNQCKQELPLSKFYKKGGTKNQYSFLCRKCWNKYQFEKQKAVKVKCAEYLGGQCKTCNYDKYIGALDFHHLDPKEKEFAMSIGRNYSFERCKPELDKCILVCKNCHAEIHHGLHPQYLLSLPLP